MFFENQPTQLNFYEYYRRWHNRNANGQEVTDARKEFVENWNANRFNDDVTSKLATDPKLFEKVCALQRYNSNIREQFDSHSLSNAAKQHIRNISDLRTAKNAQYIFYTVLQELQYSGQEQLHCRFEPLRANLPQLAQDFLNNPLTSERNIPYYGNPDRYATAQDCLFESIHVNNRANFMAYCNNLAAAPSSEQSAPQPQ